jgi:hypothetical protein
MIAEESFFVASHTLCHLREMVNLFLPKFGVNNSNMASHSRILQDECPLCKTMVA